MSNARNLANIIAGTYDLPVSSIDSVVNLGKNRIINGAMMIDQRNAGASFTNTNQAIYGLDRWKTYGLGGCTLTIQQSTVAPTGFSNSQLITVTTSTTANDAGGLSQIIEGNNAFDLDWGTSSGATVTASFWVRSSVTGTYNAWFRYFGSSATNNYLTTYTISAANTWEQKFITIPAPPTAAGAFTAALNTSYLDVRFIINSSGNTTVTTANTWSTSTAVKTTGTVDLASNSGATFYITGVQLEKGSTATSFDYRPYGTELNLCHRYFYSTEGTAPYIGHVYYDGSGYCVSTYPFPQIMRATPSITMSGGHINIVGDVTFSSIDACNRSIKFFVASASGNAGYPVRSNFTASAEL